MAKLPLNVAIILSMITGCIGPKDGYIRWTEPVDRELMNIFYEMYPHDEHHLMRVKEEWDKHLPINREITMERLKGHIDYIRLKYWNEWLERSGTDREQMEDTLVHIYEVTNDGQPHHEKRMLKELFKIHPDYYKQYELYRTVLYRWYERLAPLGKEILVRDMDWTPQRKANLLHIAKEVRGGEGELSKRIKMRWLKMYGHLNVNEHSLLRYMYKLRKDEKYKPSREEKLEADQKYKSLFASESDAVQDEGSVHKGKRIIWTDEKNADVMYIDGMIRREGKNLMKDMEDRWRKMHKDLSLSGRTLLARVHYLYNIGYKPRPEYLQDAKERYDRLPPIPRKSKQGEKWKIEQERFREGKQPIQQHQNDPTLPGFELTPERLAWLRRRTGEFDKLHTEHAHYPHQTYYYGGSSHTPSDQGSSSRQPHIPNPYDHEWYQSSSSHSQHPPQQ